MHAGDLDLVGWDDTEAVAWTKSWRCFCFACDDVGVMDTDLYGASVSGKSYQKKIYILCKWAILICGVQK